MKKAIQKITTIVGISSFFLLSSITSHAEIYKWTDQNGVTHYTATPPVQKKKRVKSTNIEDKIRFAAGKFRPSASTTKTENESENQGKGTNEEELKLAGPDKKLIKYCKSQRNNLEQLQKNYRNVWVDVKGKKTTLDQEQRKQKVKFLLTKIKEDCEGVKASNANSNS